MSVWNGWQTSLLTAAQIGSTANRRAFLTDWHNNAETNCRNNPVDLSEQSAGHSNCAALPGITARAQNYTTTGNGAHAFGVEVHRGFAADILRALRATDPYAVTNPGLVAEALTAWGSQTFAHYYLEQTQLGPPGGGVKSPHAHKGWSELQHTFNNKMLPSLHQSHKTVAAGLTTLARARKVLK